MFSLLLLLCSIHRNLLTITMNSEKGLLIWTEDLLPSSVKGLMIVQAQRLHLRFNKNICLKKMFLTF